MIDINLRWEKLKNTMFETLGKKPGMAIATATALGVATSSIAQALAISCNKKISEDKKKFLIPQELLDGVINVGISLLIITTMSKCATKLVETGKWSTDGIREMIKKLPDTVTVNMGDKETNLAKIFYDHAKPEDRKEFYHIYYSFKSGIDICFATIGSILACSIAAPFMRNYAAAKFQQAHLKKQQQDNNTNVATVVANPVQKSIANYHNYTMTAITNPTSSLKI